MPLLAALVVFVVLVGLVYWAGTRLWRGWDQLQADTAQVERRDKDGAR